MMATLTVLACGPQADYSAVSLVIRGARVIDVRDGSVGSPMDIGMADDTIVFVVPTDARAAIDSLTEVVDGSGMYAIPGLWDMHVHLWDRELLADAYLQNGVTGVRDMGGALEAWRRWEADVDSVPVPRSVVAGQIVDGLQPVVFFYARAKDSTESVRLVTQLAGRGSDFIKVYDRLTASAFTGIMARAKELGLAVAGHVPVAVPASVAVGAGLSSIEHMTGIALECAANESDLRRRALAALRPFLDDSVASERLSAPIDSMYTITRWEALDEYDRSHCPEMVQLVTQQRPWVTPTLVVTGESAVSEAERVAPFLSDWPTWVQGMIQPGNIGADARETAARLTTVRRMFADLDSLGVRWLAGSDAPNPGSVPGVGLHHELALLVDFGLTPLEALQSATWNAAQFLGRTARQGSIEPGKHADVLLLTGNPLEDIRETRQIAAVISRGRLVIRDPLTTP